MIALRNSLIDGQMSWHQGEDTYTSPPRVPRTQSTWLVNAVTRNDFLGPRPRWEQVGLTFDATTSDQANFEDGYFQRFTSYLPDIGDPHLVFAIGGGLFRVGLDGVAASFALPGTRPTLPRVWFCQGELFLIWQDGQSRPLIYDGASWRSSNVEGSGGQDADGTPLYEVPVGTCMEYYNGRLWVALPDRAAFSGGDGVFGPTGTAKYSSRDAILRFTENKYLIGLGRSFAIPANLGGITAMCAMANLDTSLGQGPLQVFTPAGAFSVDAPLDRSTWINMATPIKSPSLFGMGYLSQESVVRVNGDLWGRTLNGIAPFLVARRDFGMWANRDMSREVGKHLQDDDPQLLDRASSAVFDNRLLTTSSPQLDRDHGCYHRSLVALDFFPLTAAGNPSGPVWQGRWEGATLDILQVHSFVSKGVEYCYAAVLAPEDDRGARKIQLWKLTKTPGPDRDVLNVTTRIQRQIESPRFDFSSSGSNRLEQKRLEAADLWLQSISGTVDLYLYYRPDEYPGWFFWKHWQVCATTERCSTEPITSHACATSLSLQRQFRARLGAQRPPDNWIDSSKTDARIAYGFQYRLKIIGDCELTAIRLLATRILEPTFGSDVDSTCEELVVCPEVDPTS